MNYYGLPVHGQPAQYTVAAMAYPMTAAFVGQTAAPCTPYATAAYPATPAFIPWVPSSQLAPLVATTQYFPPLAIAAATGVTYSSADGSYQARPTFSHTAAQAAIVTTWPLTSYMAPGTYTSTTHTYPPASAVTVGRSDVAKMLESPTSAEEFKKKQQAKVRLVIW